MGRKRYMQFNGLITLEVPLKCSFLNWMTHIFHGFSQQVCTTSGNFSPKLQTTFPTTRYLHTVNLNIFQAHFEPFSMPSSNQHTCSPAHLVAMLFSGIILFLLLACSSFLFLANSPYKASLVPTHLRL